MELISFGGWVFGADDFHGGNPWEGFRNQWTTDVRSTTRRNGNAKLTGANFSTREIPVQFIWQGSGNGLIDDMELLLARLDIENVKPRTLVALRSDGVTYVERQAIVVLDRSQGESANQLNIRFISDQVRWSKQATTTVGPTAVASTSSAFLSVVNAGKARAHVQLRVSSPALSGFGIGDPPKMTSFTIANTGPTVIINQVLRVAIGSTAFLTTPPLSTALYQNGRQVRHLLVAPVETVSYVWLLVDFLAPGQTKGYQLVFNGSPGYALAGKWAPAFDIHSEANATTSGSTTTALKRTGATWEVNEWAGGRLLILSGALVGQEKLILSNTPDTIVTSAFGSAPATGIRYLLTMSQNGKWVYAVRETERTYPRGLWFITPSQTKPQTADPNTPGGWWRYLYQDNNDRKNQTRWVAATVGGDPDYFSKLDADRTYEGGPAISEDGVADGVAISLPWPVTKLTGNFTFKNPTGMAQFFIGGKMSGAEDFEELYSSTAASPSLTSLGLVDLTITGDTRQLYMGILPANGDEIGAGWGKDSGTSTTGESGTASSGSTTTINDNTRSWGSGVWTGYRAMIVGGAQSGQERPITGNSGSQLQVSPAFSGAIDSTSQYVIVHRTIMIDAKKAWVVNQWVGAIARITGGRGIGASASVTANTATQVTANFGINIDSTSQYEIVQGSLVSTIRQEDRFELQWDESTLTISAATAWTAVIPMMERSIYVGSSNFSSNPSDPPKPYQRIDLGLGTTKIMLKPTETVVIDGEQRRAWIEESGIETRQVPPAALDVVDVDASGNAVPAEQWLWLPAGTTTIGAKSNSNSFAIQATWREGWL